MVRLASRALGISERRPRRRRKLCAPFVCEPLETRQLCAVDPTALSTSDIVAHTNLSVISAVSSGPTGLTPAEIRAAYGINLIAFSGGTISGTGAGETIAIVDAYDDPSIAADLAAFDQEYGLNAPPSFTIDNLGATTVDSGWALETALDVEWAHAIAPGANIILVEAASSSLSNLLGAVSYAGKQAGVTVVSMSWGSSEFRGESSDNSVFTTAAGHVSVTYVAASGDSAAYSGPEFPSVSPNVLAVGGTSLTLTASGLYGSETGWSDSTGGLSGTDSNFSVYESEPSFQVSTLESVGLSYGVRTTPDVSFNADPSSGVSVFDSVGYGGESGWFELGGTSAAAPAWAGLVAIADQGLATGGKGSLSTSQVLTDLYSLPSSYFNDITTGSNGYNATAGYDLVTGLGTPRSNYVIAGILAANGVSETSSSATASTSAIATPAAAASPHKVNAKRAKLVVKKVHKVAHQTDLVATTILDHSSSASKSSSTATADDAISSLVVAADASQVAQELTALPPPASSAPVYDAGDQNIASTDSASTSALRINQGPPVVQSLSSDSRLGSLRQGPGSSDSNLDFLSLLNSKGQDSMTRHPIVTYQPIHSPAPDGPVGPSLNVDHTEIDAALEQLAASLLPIPFKALYPHGETLPARRGGCSPSAAAALTAAGSIAAAAYRIVLRSPDDPERKSAWCSRFPRS